MGPSVQGGWRGSVRKTGSYVWVFSSSMTLRCGMMMMVEGDDVDLFLDLAASVPYKILFGADQQPKGDIF